MMAMRENLDERSRGLEKRKFERAPVSFTVFYKVNSPLAIRLRIGESEIDALALDISEQGMAVLTGHEVPAFTIVAVRFIMLDDKAISSKNRSRSIVVQGEVRYSMLQEKKKAYRLGIKFTDLSSDDRGFIAGFVRANK